MADELPPIETSAKRLDQAYAEQFGAFDRSRTASQRLVMADLAEFCYENKPVTEATTDRAFDPNRALFNDGRRSVLLRIKAKLARAERPARSVKVTRKAKV